MSPNTRLALIIAFLCGVIVGSLAQRPAIAQQAFQLFGSNAGVAQAITTDGSGNVNVAAH